MSFSSEYDQIRKQFEKNPPKIIGGYKRQGWAQKTLDKTANDDIEQEPKGFVTAKAILEANDGSYYPAFLLIDTKKSGKIKDAFFLSEVEDQFHLIPLELALEFIDKDASELMPFRYRTLVKIKGDQFQKNWPDFS
ncbi:hypothetical protein RRV45_19955 [Bacillus sp. DTU_2020_1000418_1_SI_GHA_SEK_038]|uniref:hypothetical protein n=1 Tax=Bacillus sp. DTU_2020_1000418_1_SI_GHA_SEK_038 TaxID=3077585 RepID=UPI0028ED8CDA|nr:hypothetical protein [Bacillus sp. DTU_2020_1000418_1_SI_GHA_SEK_038]WNS75126.1 hypothetical protein RRV45_19955 [Bacillus sp. DTU_2020_1000418_1_SI_GHA_SEK_038]